ncbi:AMP-binding protein [Rhodococcus hoagii]|nr:AMP-binding protein [Prescottella equi]
MQRYPDREALRCGDESWTYTELASAAEDRSQELKARGVQAGDIVPVDAVRGARWVVEVWALSRLGAGLGADRSVAPRATSPQSARRRRERVG